MHSHQGCNLQASFPCPGHHLFKSLSLFCQLPYCFQICAALPPPHPYGRRDPRPKLFKQLPTSPAGFVLPLSFQEQALQAPGSAQKTPPLGSLFPKMARGQLLAGHRGLGRQDRTAGHYPGLGKAGGHSMDARAHTSRARAAHAQGELPGPELQGGIPGLSGTRGSCHGPIALPTRAMPGRNTTPGTTSPEDSTPAPHFFTQIGHPNHSPRGTPKCTLSYRCPPGFH